MANLKVCATLWDALSNMAGDEPYSLYAYDSYGTQTGSDYSNESYSSYKGYDKGPFGYKTGVRQYDPETGRFLSPDAFKGYLTDPASQHPYMYCHGNPIAYSDPSGYYDLIPDEKYWQTNHLNRSLPTNSHKSHTCAIRAFLTEFYGHYIIFVIT